MSSSAMDEGNGPRTVAEALGQMIVLLSQSPKHRGVRLDEFVAKFLPPIRTGQFRIFNFPANRIIRESRASDALQRSGHDSGAVPLGVAIWARLSERTEEKFIGGELLAAEDWISGTRLWIIELIAPYANEENQLRQRMLLDLSRGPFLGETFSMLHEDSKSGKTERLVFAPSGSPGTA